MYGVRQERHEQFLRFHTGIDEKDLCFRIPREKRMPDRRDVHKDYLGSKAVRRRPSAHGHIIIPIRHEKLVDGFRHQLATKIDQNSHRTFP